MPPSSSSTSPNISEVLRQPKVRSSRRKRTVQLLIIGLIISGVIIAWQLLNAYNHSTNPTIAANTTPRIYYCASDQGFYHWREGNTQIIQVKNLPMAIAPTRLTTDETGMALYGLSGQDLWFSLNSGTTWVHRWHYVGFFLPAKVVYSKDGGSSWQTLTD